MECFSHQGAEAVGACKACGRAMCRKCAIDLGFAVCCSAVCADEARDQHDMSQRAKKLYGLDETKPHLSSSVISSLLFGIFFLGYGIYRSYLREEADEFLLIIGVVSLFIAFIQHRRAKKSGLRL